MTHALSGIFSTEPFAVVDLQSTSSSHSAGSIIALAWQIFAEDKLVVSRHHLIKLEEDKQISSRVSKMTGITAEHLAQEGRLLSEVLEEFASDCQIIQAIVIHFAQFELGFLTRSGFVLPDHVKVICLHKVARLLLPDLPSHSLIALAGFLALEPFMKNNALDHVIASAGIWGHFKLLLQAQNIKNLTAVWDWQNRPATPNLEKSYRKLMPVSMNLPETPGIYQHLDHHQRVLYVGKANNLKRRVRSYFTGKQTKGSHLNTMLTQVADIKVHPTRHQTEACMLEARLIKQLRPPYNRLLNRGSDAEAKVWVGADFQCQENPRPGALLFWRDSFLIYCQTLYQVATQVDDQAEVQLHHEAEHIRTVWPLLWGNMACRNLLRFSHSCHALVKIVNAKIEDADAKDTTPIILQAPALDVAHHDATWHIIKCFSSLVSTQRRLRLLLSLANSQLLWWDQEEKGWWELRVENGVYECLPISKTRPLAWFSENDRPDSELLERETLDQMSILAAEIRRLAKSGEDVQVYCRGVNFYGRRLRSWLLMEHKNVD